MNKVLVIGLDGATWNIINPLVNRGILPTISRLMKEGCYGELESTIPASTFPAWKCYSTGKNPGKLGVFHFMNLDTEKQKEVINNSHSFKSKEIWDYLGEDGIRCGIFDMPTTYPPKSVNGFMVSPSHSSTSSFTYPYDLGQDVRRKFDYKFNPEHDYVREKDLAIEDLKNITEQRFEVAQYLIERFKPAFFHITIFYTDTIQHFYWKYMEEEDYRYGKAIEELWRLVDQGIKSLTNKFCDENTTVILMSDHGFTSLKGIFYIAPWLIKKGYLHLNRKVLLLNMLARTGVSLENLFLLLSKLGIYKTIRRTVPYDLQKKLYSLIPGKGGIIGSEGGMGLKSLIDWKKSSVIPFEGIYINTNLVQEGSREYDDLRNKLKKQLQGIIAPNGEKLFDKIYFREEAYEGKYLKRAPDIIGRTTEGFDYHFSLSPKEWSSFSRSGWSAIHKKQGIFLVCGRDIKRGERIDGAKIYDVAPTILHLFGVSIPKDIDGQVLKGIFRKNSEPMRREEVYQKIGERDRIKERVKDLRYLSKL